MNKNYKLLPIKNQDLFFLYEWTLKENNYEQYTCRPIFKSKSFDEYKNKMLNSKQLIYVIVDNNKIDKPLGKISLFDLNIRNHSAEFGYYLPYNNRSQGIGSIMVEKFIKKCFSDDSLSLNKLYATTCSNNTSSIKLLEKFNFKLDGRLREHYWINENKYDQLVYSILKSELTLTNK